MQRFRRSKRSTFPSQLIWLAVSFVLLYVLMSKIALPRIGAIFAERSKRIGDDLKAAQGFKEQSDAAHAAYEKALADARARAQAIANATREQQAAEAEAANKRLEAQLHERLAAAEQSIAATRTAAMGNVARHRGRYRLGHRRAPDRQGSGRPRSHRRVRRRAEALGKLMLEAMQETENWVALAFLLFLGAAGLSRRPPQGLDASIARQARIKAELDEARRLQEEAQALLAEFQRKGREAEKEAEAIIAGAKAEAERIAGEAKVRMEDFVSRRTKMAEAKITQAEAQALADVRSAAADAAVTAAEKILSIAAKGEVAVNLLQQGIEDVRKKLN